MTPTQRQSAIDTVKERLDALLSLAEERDSYPFNRYLADLPEAIVDAVLAVTKPRVEFPWHSDRGPQSIDVAPRTRL